MKLLVSSPSNYAKSDGRKAKDAAKRFFTVDQVPTDENLAEFEPELHAALFPLVRYYLGWFK